MAEIETAEPKPPAGPDARGPLQRIIAVWDTAENWISGSLLAFALVLPDEPVPFLWIEPFDFTGGHTKNPFSAESSGLQK